MIKTLLLLMSLSITSLSFGSGIQSERSYSGDCLFGCDTLMKWMMHRRTYEPILAPLGDDKNEEQEDDGGLVAEPYQFENDLSALR